MTAAMQCGEPQWTLRDVADPKDGKDGNPSSGLDCACPRRQARSEVECPTHASQQDAPVDLLAEQVDFGAVLEFLAEARGSFG